jgi:ferrous iron transport protein B
MAARTIESPKDRLITILVAPFASCSARIPVYLIMIATIVPSENVPVFTKVAFMIGLYALGTLGAFAFAWVFNRFLLRGESSPMILELPTYKAPSLKAVLLHMWERARIFIRRAGTIILGLSILLWFLATFPKSESSDPTDRLAESFAGRLGHAIEPAIEPLGYDWKIGVGIIASFAAREVFVSAMSVIYNVEDAGDGDMGLLRDRFLEMRHPDGRPVFTPLTCLSLLVFYVFALQCASTVAVVRRETNSWKWPLFQFAYMSATAWLGALAVYQIGTILGY